MNMIERKPVKSEAIKSIGHDPSTNTLAVEFRNGSVHHYKNVPASAHVGLLDAKSIGGHFMKHIRDKYKSEKI